MANDEDGNDGDDTASESYLPGGWITIMVLSSLGRGGFFFFFFFFDWGMKWNESAVGFSDCSFQGGRYFSLKGLIVKSFFKGK